MSSPSPSEGAETYQTVPTLPLPRQTKLPPLWSDDDPFEFLQNPRADSQKTLVDNSSSPAPQMAFDPMTVQVAASSPVAPPIRKPSGYLANLMAPAGTQFVRPPVPAGPPRAPPITIDSDDEGPQYKGGDSSDSDRASIARHNLKATVFTTKRAEQINNVPESPQQPSPSRKFSEITSGARYDPRKISINPGNKASGGSNWSPPRIFGSDSPSGHKRPGDILADAYGNVKRPRQMAPSRAKPVIDLSNEEDMDLDDIADYNIRNKIKHLQHVFPQCSIRYCHDLLVVKKLRYDDAQDYILRENAEKADQKNRQKNTSVDLTGSDDELMPTPAQRPRPALPANAVGQTRQQASKPVQSIREKFSSTQVPAASQQRPLSVFHKPPPHRKLIRPEKPKPSQLSPQKPTKGSRDADSGSEAGDSGIDSGFEDKSFSAKVLRVFNDTSDEALADTAGVDIEMAKHIMSKRPFKNLAAVRALPPLVPPKGKRRGLDIGEKLIEKVEEMIRSYEAVDHLVSKCDSIALPLVREMKSWGVNVHGSKEGELELTSMESPGSNHDSGIGTPVSDLDVERTSANRKPTRKFIGQPEIMNHDVVMKDYQIVGLNWMWLLYKSGLSGILADDMGLGKTIQVISFFASLLEHGEHGPHLVVVPAATLENWMQELKRFCPALSVEAYYASNPKERIQLQEDWEGDRDNINVIVTTYTIAKGKEDFPWLKHFGFCCTVFDEGHQLKNASSQVASKLSRIDSKFRLLLTGTPLQNNLKELVSLLGFLQPSLFKSKEAELQAIFKHTAKALDNSNHAALLSTQRVNRARSMLTPFILRRKKYQVLKELPKKERRVEYCDLLPVQAEIYNFWYGKAQGIRAARERGEVTAALESTNILMKLRQASIHPFLFRRLYPDSTLPKIAKACLKVDRWSESNPDLIVTELQAYSDFEIHQLCEPYQPLHRFILSGKEYTESGKIVKMLSLLRTFMSQGHRTLIFSQFVMVLDILELVLSHEDITYFRLDGTTPVPERQDLIDEFSREGNDTPVFMLSTKAGGAGINLAKANKVIIFDSGFNPQDDVQAENRAHRIGQVKEVEVVRLVTRGTVEEAIFRMGEVKLRLDEEVAGSGSGGGNGMMGDEGSTLGDSDHTKLAERQEEKGRKAVEELFWKGMDEKKSEDKDIGTNISVVKDEAGITAETDLKEAIKVVKMVDEQAATDLHANTDKDIAQTNEQRSATTSDDPTENRDKIIKYDPDTTSTRRKKNTGASEKEEVILPTRTRGVRAAKAKRVVIIDDDEDEDDFGEGVDNEADDDKDHEVDEDNDFDGED